MQRLICAAAIAIGFTGSVCAGSFRFDRYASYPITGSTADAVAIGDVTGDGRDDVIAVTGMHLDPDPDKENDNKVYIYAQQSNGGLKPPIQYPLAQTVGSSPGITLVDLNNDHVLDIAVGHNDGITLLIANGTGGFVRRPIMTGGDYEDLDTLDIDLDGNMDIVGLGWSEDATLFYGDGQGGIRSTAALKTLSGHKDLKIADVTGDSRPDLVVVSVTGADVFLVFPHDGTNGFGPVRMHPIPTTTWIGTVAIGDFNNDGRNDIATATQANGSYSQIWLHNQTASGQLAPPEPIASAPAAIAALVAADLDRDGRQDLVVTHQFDVFGQGPLGHYLQESGGLGSEVLTQTPSAIGPDNSQGLATGDVNHDGCPDVAVAVGGLTILRGCPNHAATRDLNIDRKSDLIWRNSITGANVIWRSANYATQQQVSGIPDPAWIAAGIADFDGDGQPDILWRNTSSGANDIWRSANSTIGQAVAPMLDLAYKVVGVGDFDGDNHSDILWRNTSTGANEIWRSANSTTRIYVDAIPDQAWQVAGIGDFDGNTKSDILWHSSSTGESLIWFSEPGYPPLNLTTVANLDWKIVGVGDFNGDAKSDILWRNSKTGANLIWQSANSATRQTVTGVTNLAWKVAGTGDYNGDGKSDVLWRNASTGANVLWKSANYATQQPVTGVTNQAWKIVP